jgi:hypothetical protein
VTDTRTAPASRVNSLAVLALVFAFVFAPAGIVLAHLARRRITESGERGAGLATAALVVGYVIVAVAVVTLAATVLDRGGGDGGYTPSGTGY